MPGHQSHAGNTPCPPRQPSRAQGRRATLGYKIKPDALLYIHIKIHTHRICIYNIMYTCICIYIYIHIIGSASKWGFVAVPHPLLQTFVAGPLLQTLVAGLCVEYRSLQQACRREGLSHDPPNLLQVLSQKGRPGPLQARSF